MKCSVWLAVVSEVFLGVWTAIRNRGPLVGGNSEKLTVGISVRSVVYSVSLSVSAASGCVSV